MLSLIHILKIEESWRQHIGEEFDKQYFVDLTNFVKEEYLRTPCYPPVRLIFNAFNLCPFDDVKVVYYGQNECSGHAAGLDFKRSGTGIYYTRIPPEISWVVT